MITTILLIVLGGLLALVLWQMFKPSAAKQHSPAAAPLPFPAPASQPGAVELLNVRQGDVISIHGAAADFSDLDFTVDRRSMYQSGSRGWLEVSGDFRGDRVYMEVYPGAEPQVIGIVDPRRITIADIGVTEDRLADLDARQDPSQFIAWDGKVWQYESSREIGYFENEQGEGEGFYRWVFREDGGEGLLVIEKWEGEPFEARIARKVNPQDVSVFRAHA